MKGISRYLRTSKKGINYELKTGLFVDDLLLFRCFRKGFIAHWRFANDPHTLYDRVNASRLQRFRKTAKHMNRGKTQCWAIFVISKATFTKTVIEPKFDDRLFLKNFSAAIDQCSIYSPIFCIHEKVPNEGAKLSKYWSDVIHLDNFLLWDFLLSRV